MKKFSNFLIFFLLFYTSNATEVISNFGRTGLIENPTAYKVEDGHLLFGSSYVYPYWRFFVNNGFFPALEIGGTVTVIRNIKPDPNDPRWSGYGSYKDKAFFFKYQLLPETEKYPAIAIGYDDFHGTKLFENKYVVITKYIDGFLPQNLTIGYSKGTSDGLFYGAEILLHPKLSFVWEYSPLKKEKLKGMESEIVKTKFNIGLKFQPLSWFQSTLTIQRGKRWGINISFDMPMGKPWLPHKPKYFILTKEDIELIKKNKQTEFFEKALKRLDFEYSKVYIRNNTLYIETYNKGYFFESVAVKKIISIFKVVYFPNVKDVVLVLKEKNVPITKIKLSGVDINNYLMGKITFEELLENSKLKFSYKYKPLYDLTLSHPYLSGNIKMRTFLNDPSGAFKYEISYDITLKEYIFNNFFLTSRVAIPLTNNIKSINEPLMENPVRSDIDRYLGQQNIKLMNLSLNYMNSIYKNTFIGISAGYNEMMFAGIGGDMLYFIGDGKHAVGIGGDFVRKRDENVLFSIKNNKNFYDYYLSYYYSMDYPEININVKAGRFLAGDKGVRLEISRNVKGFEVGFWYTYSDTSKFTGDNKDYHDKGVFIAIPLRIFRFKDTPQTAYMSLAPWTRDVGQLAGRPLNLYRTIKRKSPYYIKVKADEEE